MFYNQGETHQNKLLKKKLTFSFEPQHYEALQAKAEEIGCSKAELLRALVKKFLDEVTLTSK